MKPKARWNGFKLATLALAFGVALLVVAGVAEAHPNPAPPIVTPTTSTTSSNNLSYTVPAGNNRLLVVTVFTGSEQTTTSVNWTGTNSGALTLAISADQTGNAQVMHFYRVVGSGVSSSGTVQVSFTGTSPNPSVVSAYTYFDVNQTTPINNATTAVATAADCGSGSGVSVSMSGMNRSSIIHAGISMDGAPGGTVDNFAATNVSEILDSETTAGNDLTYWAGYSLVNQAGQRTVGGDPNLNEQCALAAFEIQRVTTPGYNPDLQAACGLDVILVLDASASIDATDRDDVIDAADAFFSSLVGTGSNVAVVEFGTVGIIPFGWMPLSPANLTVLQDYLINDYHTNPDTNAQYTNWQDAYNRVVEINNTSPVADLVIFMTDGDPTAYMDGNTPVTLPPTTQSSHRLAILYALPVANQIRQQGSHLLGIGVGLTAGQSEARLSAVTGSEAYPHPEFKELDYAVVSDFTALGNALREVAFELCENSITLTKYVDDGFEEVAVPDFPVSGTTTVTSGGAADSYTWLQPLPSGHASVLGTTRAGLTGATGAFTWQWETDNPASNTQIVFSESSTDLTPLATAECVRNSPGVLSPQLFNVVGGPTWTVSYLPGEFAACELMNQGVWDWGDAPDSYGTTGLASGPRHLMYTGDPIIGVLRDAEANGQPSASATGDDLNNLADEDGLSIPLGSNWSDGQGEMSVTITNGPACLNAWVDFNNNANTVDSDGDFNDAGEHVLVNYNAVNGVNNTTFPLPIDAANDAVLYMRFRVTPMGTGACLNAETPDNYLYADGIPTPYNQGFGGEVQDMVVNFSPTAITLNSQAVAAGNLWPAGVIAALGAMAALTALMLARSRRRAR